MRLLKYLSKHLGAVALVFVLLMCQAFCDLMLPNYTAQIVDVGIQQAGVEHVATEELSAGSYSFVAGTSGDGFNAQLFADSYSFDSSSGTYRLTSYGESHRVELDMMMAVPLAQAHGLGQSDASENLVAQMGVAAATAFA